MTPAVLMAAGTAFQMVSQYGANILRAKAEEQNASFYNEQAVYAIEANQREQRLANTKYEFQLGQQVGSYAASGVDSSGSASLLLGSTIANQIQELTAIKRKGELDVKLARLRAGQSQEMANTLSSTGYNATQAGGTLLTNYVQTEGYGKYADKPSTTRTPRYDFSTEDTGAE